MFNKTVPLYPAGSRLFCFGGQVQIACAFQAFHSSWPAKQKQKQNRKEENRTEYDIGPRIE